MPALRHGKVQVIANCILFICLAIALTSARSVVATEASQPSPDPDPYSGLAITYLGQNNRAAFEFRSSERLVTDPYNAFFVPYRDNPVIDGYNLYAPSPVKSGDGWTVYYGGWRTSKDLNDEIYVSSTGDGTLGSGWTPPLKIVEHGIYVHANDPSIIERSGTWYMSLSTAGYVDGIYRDWCSILSSKDGVSWPTLADRSREISIVGAQFTGCARPSLIWNDTQSRWELYFDGQLGQATPYSNHLAYSTQATPHEFIYQQPIGDMLDADVKLVNGLYIGAYRHRQIEQDEQWKIYYATSADGRNFTEHGLMLAPDPLNPYDDYGVTNPGWALDGSKIVGVMFGGTAPDLSHQQIGIAYPQVAVTLKSGEISHVFRQALDPFAQRIETFQYDDVDQAIVQTSPDKPGVTLPITASKGAVHQIGRHYFSGSSRESADASTTQPSFPTANGIDGSSTTFWSSIVHSTPEAPEWFAVDLGSEQIVRRISVVPRSGGYGFPVDFRLEYSSDNQSWTLLPEQTYANFPRPGAGPVSFALDHALTARYIRLSATKLGADNFNNYYLQLAEVYPEQTCALSFVDVPSDYTFYHSIQSLACGGVISGYTDHTFRPGNNVSRGQAVKIIANARGYQEIPTTQTFEDVTPGDPFYEFVERISRRRIADGYPCGGPGEPCRPPSNRPYFRPGNSLTRGQVSKMIANAWGYNEPQNGQTFEDVLPNSPFYPYIERLADRRLITGYACGGAGEPCVGPDNRPYFRPASETARGQFTKLVYGALTSSP